MALVCDLRAAGIVERKSQDPRIVRALLRTPTELQRHFVRGLFDGDGSAFVAGSGTRIVELSGHALMLEAVRKLAVRELGVARNLLVRPSGGATEFATVRWRHPLDVAKLTAWFYEGASTWLERKHAVLRVRAAHRSASIYRGVYRRRGRWGARVHVGGRRGRVVSAGMYDDEISAARAYDRLVAELVGPEAPLNRPNGAFCEPDDLGVRSRQGTNRMRNG
jgi:hypothetical protein